MFRTVESVTLKSICKFEKQSSLNIGSPSHENRQFLTSVVLRTSTGSYAVPVTIRVKIRFVYNVFRSKYIDQGLVVSDLLVWRLLNISR